MPALELEFEVYCTCGEGLCNQVTEEGKTPNREMPYITVAPCKHCLERAREEGHEKGHDEGYDQGCLDTEKQQEKRT